MYLPIWGRLHEQENCNTFALRVDTFVLPNDLGNLHERTLIPSAYLQDTYGIAEIRNTSHDENIAVILSFLESAPISFLLTYYYPQLHRIFQTFLPH